MEANGPNETPAPDAASTRLGRIFDEDARTYDRMRPRYPSELFDDLVRLGSLESKSRVLEIGAGTGHATVHLARRGLDVLALEPGPNLAAVAKQKVRSYGAVRVHVQSFEEWQSPSESFDAVVAATSFHWMDPNTRAAKASRLLRPGGLLAIISTHHVAGGTVDFFEQVQACYERHMPGTPPGLGLPGEDAVPNDEEELVRVGTFGRIEHRNYPWDETYATSDYLSLLTTYSGHRALASESRRELFACIERVMDGRFGGRISKRYLFRLTTAERIDPDDR